MEPKVIESSIALARSSTSDWSYAGCGSLWQHSGSGNNWALGHHHFGPRVRDAALDLVRKEVEACDWLEGFLLLQSVAGGTGSGLGTYLAEALSDELRQGQLVNVCIWPYESGEVAVQPYNALLALSHLSDVSDGLLLMQNEVLHATCTKMLGVQRPGFMDLNRVAAGALGGALLPAYPRPARGPLPQSSPPRPGPALAGRSAPGQPQPQQQPAARPLGRIPLHPLGDLTAHLTCHPRFRLASVRHVPQITPGNLDFTTFTWNALLRRMRRMAATGSFVEEGMEWGTRPYQPVAQSAVASSSSSPPHQLPPHRYKNKAASSMLLLRGQQAAEVDVSEFEDPTWHAGWSVSPMVVGASTSRYSGCQMAATLLATDQACVAPLSRMQERGYRMASARAFIHQYEAYGMEEGQLLGSFACIEDTLACYAAL